MENICICLWCYREISLTVKFSSVPRFVFGVFINSCSFNALRIIMARFEPPLSLWNGITISIFMTMTSFLSFKKKLWQIVAFPIVVIHDDAPIETTIDQLLIASYPSTYCRYQSIVIFLTFVTSQTSIDASSSSCETTENG